ncbi:beta-ketoacyl-[acyl-carrier-protein] synthase family protein [Schlesneria sp. T3-172]|uniref:beta-ketoacyl-[acyl-carrier-protein] synthase family protein n=1 Tax=Schlesneria sphaerica TaxID=3373610 RepID=UPI0037C6D170
MKKRRVVVTGLGCVSPVGNSPAESWNALLNGQSGVSAISIFDASNYPARIAAEVKNFGTTFPEVQKRYPKSGRNIHFAIAAGAQAVRDSGLQQAGYDPGRIGVYTGAGEGSQDFELFMSMVARSSTDGNCDLPAFNQLVLANLDAAKEMEQEPHMVSAHLAAEFGFEGPNLNTLTACAAAAQAIGESAKLIEDGLLDAALTGGSSSMIHPFGVTGFCLLTTLSTRNDDPTRASRPFDLDRNGFVLGEGAGIIILEEYEAARRRGAPIYAELTGYGSTADAYRVTDIHPEGRGAVTAMKLALQEARLNPSDVSYLNAHGTSTKANDALETLAIRKVFGTAADHLPVSSTKSMTGHLVAAGGGIEAVFSVMAIGANVIPPTMNYETPDPQCDLDYVPLTARELPVSHVLSNSFGFGGQNVSLLFSQI